jgi:hypothetical protein
MELQERIIKDKPMQENTPYILCSICGWLVPLEDVTMEVEGVYADYKKGSMGQWHLIVCEHCRMKLNEIVDGGDEGALARMGRLGTEHL